MYSGKISVLIVDDHTMVHIGLSTMLEAHDEFHLVGLASSGEEALSIIEAEKPDVVLMDILMPGMGGVEAMRQINKRFKDICIIAITSYDEANHVTAALDAGASAYLLKNVTAQKLAEAIHDAVGGRMTLAPEAAQTMLEAARRPRQPKIDLTDREIDVLQYLARGYSNGQIAQALVVSPFTIKTHVSHILSKMNASTRAEAAAYAVQLGIVELD